MTETPASTASRFYISLWLPTAILGMLLVIILVMQVSLSWQAHQRLSPITEHISQMALLQGTNLKLQNELVSNLNGDNHFTIEDRMLIQQELKDILDLKAHMEKATPGTLSKARKVLADVKLQPREALILAISLTRDVIEQESKAHHNQIAEVNHATAMELEIGLVALLVFPSAAILLIYLLRRRILAPLDHLGFLMTLLAHKDYATAPVESIDPILRPLTENYNTMVTRLIALEREHKDREDDLEGQVRNATATLLEQQRSLANTERLAAVGETMARIAHELRNPLAGVKMATTNLRQDLLESHADTDIIERINIIVAEIDRIVLLLNTLLDQSRHNPEPLREVVLSRIVSDLVVLVHYQIPDRIKINQVIPPSIICLLPVALLCQVLLNLILNAAQAIDGDEGIITIEAIAEHEVLRVVVSDDGPGFPEDILRSAVRTFVSHRTGGTGLGLSMIDRFVRSSNGRLLLENSQPHGAKVTIELPCRRENV